jgi:hypothetical protein
MPEYGNQDTDRSSTFGRSLMNYINSKLPYQSYTAIDTISKLNPKYRVFQDTGSRRTEALARQSISSNSEINNLDPAGIIGLDNNFTQYMYANIQHDKITRLRDYRTMASFSEVADALDEICDESVNRDKNGRVIRLTFPELDLDDKDKEIIQGEFQKYINYFDLPHKGWEYFRQLFVDGEIYFEHIIHKSYEEEGILGVVNIPTEFIDPIFGNVQNMMIKGFLLRKPIFDKTNPTKVVDYEMVPMDKNQVTYINSGIWNENRTIRLPFIENARRAYRQLSLTEDAIVIYRLARAPERLVFNVDVGNMPPPKAEAYLKKLMNQYWSSKTYDNSQNKGTAVTKFNPQSILDNFWFAKRQGSEGTNVTRLEGGQNLGKLEDLEYFVKKLYKSLKVPVSRLNVDDSYKDDANILREELKFAKFVVRMQQNFSQGLKNGFITHLRLRGMWKKYDLREDHIDLQFNVPINFFEMREAQKQEIKTNTFQSIVQASDNISKTYALKKYMDWTDVEVKANREFMRKDMAFAWELDQIKAGGPNWKENAVAAAGEAGGELGGAAPGGVTGSTPPAFGPTPGGEVGTSPEVAAAAAAEPAPVEGGAAPGAVPPVTPAA